MRTNVIKELRKFRIDIEDPLDFLNVDGEGLAIFDLAMAVGAAYLVDKSFNLSMMLPGKNRKETYYLGILLGGILVHFIFARIRPNNGREITFLNRKLTDKDANIYKILFVFMILKAGINLFSR